MSTPVTLHELVVPDERLRSPGRRLGFRLTPVDPGRLLAPAGTVALTAGALFAWAGAPVAIAAAVGGAGLVASLGGWRLGEARNEAAAKRHAATLRRLESLTAHASDLVAAVEGDSTVRYASPSLGRLLGCAPDGLIGRRLLDLVHPAEVATVEGAIDRALRASRPGGVAPFEWRLRREGEWLPIETSSVVRFADPAGSGSRDGAAPRLAVLTSRDIRERKAFEAELTHQAFHDPLTGLANRTLFRDRVEHALERRGGPSLAVLFVDLDDFKTINDSLGHAAGDQVLVEASRRLRACLRAEDTAARLGGDEFAVLVEEADAATATRVSERARAALSVPVTVFGTDVVVGASVGIALGAGGTESAGELLRNADAAMYTAKSRGKGRSETFEPGMYEAARARLELEADLRRGLERSEFVLHYQPIVALDTGRLIGAEALVRWNHPTRGMIWPADFIPLAEETNLILPLGAWVLEQACRQLAVWQREHPRTPSLLLSVNLSARQLVTNAIVTDLASSIRATELNPAGLILEVTETALMTDPVTTATTLRELRALGARIAIDDFGSGYSSLSHLRRFPVDIVKIDKSFIENVDAGSNGSAIARGIIELGRAMRLQTVAEGIEGGGQWRTLQDLGCELGQGFHFARPLEDAEFERLLNAGNATVQEPLPATAGA